MIDDRVKQTLLRADELIGEYGWTQGAMGNQGVGFCLVGAVRRACRSRWRKKVDEEQVLRALEALRACAVNQGNLLLGPYLFNLGLSGWNDWVDRTEEQVRQLLQDTAEDRCAA